MAGANTRILNESSFDEIIGSTDLPVVVDFWATWCPPCRILGPTIDELADTTVGTAIVGKVDVDENKQLASKFGISSIPTVLIFKGGKVVGRHVGVHSLETFTESIAQAGSGVGV